MSIFYKRNSCSNAVGLSFHHLDEDLLRILSNFTPGLGEDCASKFYNKREEERQKNLSKPAERMKRLHNEIKLFLTWKFTQLVKKKCGRDHIMRGIDLACGSGKDLEKWQKCNIVHLVCVDISSSSLVRCANVFDSLMSKEKTFTAEFIKGDFSEIDLEQCIKNPELKSDLVTCYFALHYGFETFHRADRLVRNISSNLCNGGFFVATFLDHRKIECHLREAGKNEFGNELFSIKFPPERTTNGSPYGDKYHFYFEGSNDCPEYIVHLPTLIQICKDHRLELVYQEDFSNLNTFIKNRSHLPECIPETFEPISKHSKMENFNLDMIKLSPAESEASRLYMAVAFMKTE